MVKSEVTIDGIDFLYPLKNKNLSLDKCSVQKNVRVDTEERFVYYMTLGMFRFNDCFRI